MNKKEIINEISSQYGHFINYINNLSPQDFEFRYKSKWSAGQQLEHIVLSITSLVKVFEMPKSEIEIRFGQINRHNRQFTTYDQHVSESLMKLNAGGKAPAQYIPESFDSDQKGLYTEKLIHLVKRLTLKVEEFEESELESLLVPHPILGNITLKEVLYNAIYHVQHHKSQIKQYLILKEDSPHSK